MFKFSKKNKERLNETKKGILAIGSGVLFGTALVAAGPAVGVAAAGTAVVVLATKEHLSAGFRAGLKKWRQTDNQPLSLRARLLKFRQAVSVGLATANNSLEKEKMDRNPFYKAVCEKAAKEGRKVKRSEKLKAAMQFSTVRHQACALHKAYLNQIIADKRRRS